MSVYTGYTGYTGFVALPFPVIFLRFFFHYLFVIMSHLSPGKKEAIVILHKNGFSHRTPPKIGTSDVHGRNHQSLKEGLEGRHSRVPQKSLRKHAEVHSGNDSRRGTPYKLLVSI